MIKFAERLRELRKERHVTQKDMGEILGIQLRSYQCYESGDRRPDYEKLVALADYFDVTTDYLWGGATCGGNMGWAAVRRPRGILLPQGAGPAGCTPHFLFPLVEKKTGRARSKRKDRLDALRRVRASARRGSADRCKRRFWPAFGHAIIFCNFWDCRPVADGAEVVGVVIALSLLLFSLPLAVPRRNWCNGRMWTSARKHKPLRPPG